MTEIDYKWSELSTIGDFAAEKGVNAQTLKNAVDKQEIKWAVRAGSAHLYTKTSLVEALGTTSLASKVGYVHPDKFKELQDLHAESVKRVIELEAELQSLQDKFEELTGFANAAADAALSV